MLSDLGQFDFEGGQIRLTHLHPGVTVERVQAKTGFALQVADDLRETEPPSGDELRLLREEIDPLGIRRLEVLPGPARKSALREILLQESGL